MKTTEDRFHEKYMINQQTGCWNWTAAKNSKGYGVFGGGLGSGKVMLAHRWALWKLKNVELPPDMVVDHTCNNKTCVNPEHLRLVTPTENVMGTHHQTPQGVNARRTHCVRGHPLSGMNLNVREDGRRRCRQCEAEVY